MGIPTEPIGSIPRPQELLGGNASEDQIDAAVADTVRRFEETGSPVITDGEQRKQTFVTYPIAGAPNLAPDGVDTAFAKIVARIGGTKLAERELGL